VRESSYQRVLAAESYCGCGVFCGGLDVQGWNGDIRDRDTGVRNGDVDPCAKGDEYCAES